MKDFLLAIAALLIGCNAASACSNMKPAGEGQNEYVTHSPGKPEHPLQVQLRAPKHLVAGAERDAELIVSSAYRLASVDVELQPASGMMVSESRFERRDGGLRSNDPVRLPFRLTSAVNEPQQLTVIVRATLPDGRVMSREVALPVGGADKSEARPRGKGRERAPEHVPEPGEEVVVPAEQEMVRDDG